MKSSLLRKIFSKQFWRRALFLFVAFVTCIAAAYHIETFRSKRAWERYKQEAQQRGREFDPAAFNKPAIPDDQNYAANPYLMSDSAEADQMLKQLSKISNSLREKDSLSEGTRFPLAELLKDMQEKQIIPADNGPPADQILAFLRNIPALDSLQQASVRTDCRFPSDYRDGYMMEANHILKLSKAAPHFANRAHAAIAKNDAVSAMDDCRQLFRMSEALQTEGYLLSVVVRVAVLHRVASVIHDGILAGIWTSEQLRWLDKQWEQQDLLTHLVDSAKSERAIFCAYMEVWAKGQADGEFYASQGLRKLCPSGWFYRNALVVSKMQERFETSFEENGMEKKMLLGPSFDETYDSLPSINFWNQMVYQETFLIATQKDLIKKMLLKYNVFRATRVAIGLEIAKAEQGQYPSTLAPLIGDAAYACDVSDGKIFDYQVTADGYELRSSDSKTLWKIKHAAAR